MLIPADAEWAASRCTLPDIVERLSAGTLSAFRIGNTDAALLASVRTTRDSGRRAVFIEGLGGHVGLRPKDNFRLLKLALAECEAMARSDGCTEMRIEAQTRSGLKQRLFHRLGFEAVSLPTGLVMRKALNNG